MLLPLSTKGLLSFLPRRLVVKETKKLSPNLDFKLKFYGSVQYVSIILGSKLDYWRGYNHRIAAAELTCQQGFCSASLS